MTDADGIPLVVRTGPANQPDANLALAMLDAIPPCGGRKGRPRRRPEAFQGDGAYGIKAIIAEVVRRRVHSLLAPYGKARTTHGSGLGQTRYVVERSLSWMSNFRGLSHWAATEVDSSGVDERTCRSGATDYGTKGCTAGNTTVDCQPCTPARDPRMRQSRSSPSGEGWKLPQDHGL